MPIDPSAIQEQRVDSDRQRASELAQPAHAHLRPRERIVGVEDELALARVDHHRACWEGAAD